MITTRFKSRVSDMFAACIRVLRNFRRLSCSSLNFYHAHQQNFFIITERDNTQTRNKKQLSYLHYVWPRVHIKEYTQLILIDFNTLSSILRDSIPYFGKIGTFDENCVSEIKKIFYNILSISFIFMFHSILWP